MAWKKYPKRTVRDKIWNSMRRLGRFDMARLARTASARPNNVYKYLEMLETHGFIVRDGSNVRGMAGSFQGFLLVDDVGPQRPLRCPRCKQPLTAKTCEEKDHE